MHGKWNTEGCDDCFGLIAGVEREELDLDAPIREGRVFKAIHGADGYQFANAKDPSGNPISVSSRNFRKV